MTRRSRIRVNAEDAFVSGCLYLSVAITVAAGTGWVLNIIKLAQHINEPLTAFECLRCVGVIMFPVGCILGWIQ